MIDLHSHILPGVDDGSKDVEMSREMLEMLSHQGVDAVVATPHFYAASDNPEAFLRRREEGFARLGETRIPVLPGAEVAYFDGMSRSDILPRLCLGNSRLLLVEMPWGDWSSRMVYQVCELTVQQGVIPVLAHVNRYREAFMKYASTLAQQGVLFQWNAEVFCHWRTRRWALTQLKTGNVHFLGSDCHNLTTRPPQIGQAAQVITKKLGAASVADMTAFTAEMLNITDR